MAALHNIVKAELNPVRVIVCCIGTTENQAMNITHTSDQWESHACIFFKKISCETSLLDFIFTSFLFQLSSKNHLSDIIPVTLRRS